MINKTEILNKLEQINKIIDSFDDGNSLYVGKAGLVLYKAYYNKTLNCNKFAIEEDLENIFESLANNVPVFTYCAGVAGTIWAYKHLIKENLLDADDDALDELIPYLTQEIKLHQDQKNFDFLHGATGMIWSLLETNTNGKYNEVIERYILNLQELAVPTEHGLKWKLPDLEGNDEIVNFSLSHGISSIIIALCECNKQGILPDICKQLITGVLNNMLSYKNTPAINHSVFPNTSNDGSDIKECRLAWCYGDLGHALAFKFAGEVLANSTYSDLAKEIVAETLHRKDLTINYVKDAPVCHGAAGLALIYNHFYHAYNDSSILEVRDYWAEQLLVFDSEKNDLSGFAAYQHEKGFKLQGSLLEGLIGIGLVLLTLLEEKEEPNWPRLLMLV